VGGQCRKENRKETFLTEKNPPKLTTPNMGYVTDFIALTVRLLTQNSQLKTQNLIKPSANNHQPTTHYRFP